MFDDDYTLPFDIERALEEICLHLSLDEDQEFSIARNAFRYIMNPNCVKEKLSYYKNMSICAGVFRTGVNKGQPCQRTSEEGKRTCKLHHAQEKDLPPITEEISMPETETEEVEIKPKPIGKNDLIIRPNGFGNMLFPNTNYILFEKKIVAKEGAMGKWIELSDSDLDTIKRLRDSGKKLPKVCKMDLTFRGDVKPPKK